ncbi:MAG: Spy/CpxP family protein refolding chaperone [Pseudomonadota bacterium]
MKMTRMMTLAVFGLGALLLATTAEARGPRGQGRGGHGGKGGMGPQMLEQLDLSNEQRTQIEKSQLAMRQDLVDIKAQLREKKDQLRDLWLADNPSEKSILAKHKEMDPLRNKIRERKIKHRLEVHKILTPDQRAKLGELAKKRGKGPGGPRGPGGPGFDREDD